MAFPTNIGRDGRRFVRAVCWSLALHGILLWPAALLAPVGQAMGRSGTTSVRLDVRVAAAAASPHQVRTGYPEHVKPRQDAAPAGPVPAFGPRRAAPARGAVSEQESEGLDADDLRTYRLTLAVEARPHWYYPSDALRQNLAGTVEIRISMAGNGGGSVSLERSSGHRVLDDAALGMLRSALVAARAPEGLRGKRFSLVMPVVFSQEGAR